MAVAMKLAASTQAKLAIIGGGGAEQADDQGRDRQADGEDQGQHQVGQRGNPGPGADRSLFDPGGEHQHQAAQRTASRR